MNETLQSILLSLWPSFVTIKRYFLAALLVDNLGFEMLAVVLTTRNRVFRIASMRISRRHVSFCQRHDSILFQ